MFYYFIDNKIKIPISNYIASHIKRVYSCKICGMMISPWFNYKDRSPYECGWKRLSGTKEYVCHHCLSHMDTSIPLDTYIEKYVEPNNKKLKYLIYRIDKSYYYKFISTLEM